MARPRVHGTKGLKESRVQEAKGLEELRVKEIEGLRELWIQETERLREPRDSGSQGFRMSKDSRHISISFGGYAIETNCLLPISWITELSLGDLGLIHDQGLSRLRVKGPMPRIRNAKGYLSVALPRLGGGG